MAVGGRKENPEFIQKKVYFLLEQLQKMAEKLPLKYQQRIPIELLSNLAHCLLDDMIFEIVKGLMELQHVTEKQLHEQRQEVIETQKIEVEEVLEKFPRELWDKYGINLNEKHKKELEVVDMNIIRVLDLKVTDQQKTLEEAGVPGFYVTSNPLEIKVQMFLIDFILRLSKSKMLLNFS